MRYIADSKDIEEHKKFKQSLEDETIEESIEMNNTQ